MCEKTAHVVSAVMQMKKLQARKYKDAVLFTDPAADTDDMAEAKQRALLDQRHLETYHRIHRLRDRLYQHYSELLTEKIQRQRQELKMHHDSASQKNTENDTEQRKRKPPVQKLIASTLKHDDAYLAALPKTRYYLILELQRLLAQRGCLQGPREQEVFQHWVDQAKTAQLEKQLQQIVLRSKSAPVLTVEDLLQKKKKKKMPEHLPQIQVSTEESSTQQKHQTAVSESASGALAVSPRLYSKQIQNQTELKFPSVFSQELRVPRFSTLQPRFLETFKTNPLLLRVKEPPHQSKAAVVTQHQLRLMHSLSLSHIAHTHRLLDKTGLALHRDTRYSISDLLEHVCPNKISINEPRCSTQPLLPPLQSLEDHSKTELPKPSMEDTVTPSHQASSRKQTDDSALSYDKAPNSSSSDVPLSMEDIHSPSISLAKDPDDKTWTNYVS
ncbi:uncharacterized protein si:ch211-130h14.4 isoform X1 [Astyanax mexicanus]|uniref:uncharacterized protein si:ch211-130h14.4 isoform X1 n=1 Tax=Astyanax mexicanus TaxID=7994 RepID=UPI0020CB4CC1|nr:uncharacterized protein si:ch211-130h14.4 isoform X1 [Astyanax mexicanus]